MATDSRVKTVAADMDSRTVLPTLEEAETFLGASAERFADWNDHPLVAPALLKDESGEPIGFDPAVYGSESSEIMVALLKNRGEKGQVSTLKAIVVAPIPTLDALLADDAGRAFVQEIIHKELNHRAVRALREAADVSTVADQIPFTLDGYISSSRESGGIMETFNETYKAINATLSKARAIWAKARLTKNELKKAMESKGYALEFYAPLEESGKDGSLFEAAIALGINAAKREGMDPTIFERWKATRDSKQYAADDEDEEELDLDSLTESMLTEAPAEEATETPVIEAGTADATVS